MTHRTDAYDRAKSDMLGELNKAIRAADEVRKAEADDAAAAALAIAGDEPGDQGPGVAENSTDAGDAGTPPDPDGGRVIP